MKRNQLAHVLREVSLITNDAAPIVIGSQSVLASFSEEDLPQEATASMEVDTAFDPDPGGVKWIAVDQEIGELSDFHDRFGYYAQGVEIKTAILPEGWKDRLVTYEVPGPGPEPTRARCLEPHDCILAKLARFEGKDVNFSYALVKAGLIDLDILAERVGTLPASQAVIERIQTWIKGMRKRKD